MGGGAKYERINCFGGGLGIDSCLVRKGSGGSGVLRPLFTMLLRAAAKTHFFFSGLLLSPAATHAAAGGPATAAVAGHVHR